MNRVHPGFVLVESLVYIVVLVMVAGAIGYFVFTIHEVYRSVLLGAQADRVGTTIINQVVRDTRAGINIDYTNSSLGVANGAIAITHPDGTMNVFQMVDSQILFTEGSNPIVALTPATVSVTRFFVTEITSPISDVLQYDVGISYEVGGATETRYYNGVAILRRSYD